MDNCSGAPRSRTGTKGFHSSSINRNNNFNHRSREQHRQVQQLEDNIRSDECHCVHQQRYPSESPPMRSSKLPRKHQHYYPQQQQIARCNPVVQPSSNDHLAFAPSHVTDYPSSHVPFDPLPFPLPFALNFNSLPSTHHSNPPHCLLHNRNLNQNPSHFNCSFPPSVPASSECPVTSPHPQFPFHPCPLPFDPKVPPPPLPIDIASNKIRPMSFFRRDQKQQQHFADERVISGNKTRSQRMHSTNQQNALITPLPFISNIPPPTVPINRINDSHNSYTIQRTTNCRRMLNRKESQKADDNENRIVNEMIVENVDLDANTNGTKSTTFQKVTANDEKETENETRKPEKTELDLKENFSLHKNMPEIVDDRNDGKTHTNVSSNRADINNGGNDCTKDTDSKRMNMIKSGEDFDENAPNITSQWDNYLVLHTSNRKTANQIGCRTAQNGRENINPLNIMENDEFCDSINGPQTVRPRQWSLTVYSSKYQQQHVDGSILLEIKQVSPESSETEQIDENLKQKSSQEEKKQNEKIKEKLNEKRADGIEKQINHKTTRSKLDDPILIGGGKKFIKDVLDVQQTAQESPRKLESKNESELDAVCEQIVRQFEDVTDQKVKICKQLMAENEQHRNRDIEKLRSEIEERKTRVETFQNVISWLKTKHDYSDTTVSKEIARFHDTLPIYNIRLKLKKTFEDASKNRPIRVVIVTAETGSGKSTQIPLYLALDGIIADDMRVLCTAPRKLAARSVAHYVSRELQNTKYFASAKIEGFLTCAQAKIVFITPWHLLKELRENEMLKEYGCVMIDEAHERSIDGDLCLSVIKRIMRSREDLKLVITSASMDEGVFKKYFDEFGVATLSITNRQYPVEIKYALPKKNMDHVTRCLDEVVELCKDMVLRAENNDWEALGDILVFLTSPSEVQDAEIRLQKILTGIQYPAHVEILSLHGRMNRREQSRACAPCHGDCLFRVLFATNVAEASLTIPNVRYVIDCGLAKRERYDAIRETSIIQLGRISKSEAQQRTGRAGRTAPGICYRLYSEEDYETMEKVPIPEIMRKNLDSVLLYLLSVGVEKPETFDFIGESIGKERFQQSYTTLTSLQAVESSGGILSLTQMGRQMTAFPIPPTLSYMILESKKYSIVPEMAVICACINIRSIFSYRRSQEGKYRADSVRLRLNDELGDPLTYLRVFSEYIKSKRKSCQSWCRTNDVSEKAMEQVLQLVKQIVRLTSRDSEQYYAFNCERYEFGIDGAAQVVRRLFCEVFKRNVAVYSGSLQGGYINMATEERVWIHPASSLRQLGVTPEYIVYEYAHCTSRLFANDVMQADADWVKSVVSDHVLKRIEELKFTTYTVRMGPTAKCCLRNMVEQIKEEVDPECHITRNRFGDCYDRLQIYVQRRNLDALQKFIERHIRPEVDRLKEETCEFPVINTDYKIHIGAGAIAKEILLRGEYCTIFAGRGHKYFDWRINTKFLHDELYPHFEKYGKITSVVCFREFLHERTGCACKIRFDNKEIARRVVEAHVDDSDWGVSVEPESVKKVNISQVYDFQRFFIDVRWRRRKSHRCGKALLPNISFEQLQRLGERLAREHFPSQVETHYGHHQSLFDEQTDSLRWDQAPPEIFFREMDEEMTSEELHERIEPHCRALNIDLKADCVFVIYDKSYPPESGEKLREYKERISSYLERLGMESKIIPESIEAAPSTSMQSEIDHVNNRELPFDIEIDPVKRASDLEITARVHFLNVDIGRRFMSAVERNVESTGVPLSMGDVVVDSVKMRECYEIGFEMSKRLLTSLYDDLADLEQRIQRSGLPVSLKRFPSQQNRFAVAVIGSDYERVCEAHQQLRALVEGITLDCRDANERRRAGEQSLVEQPYYKLLSDGARMFNQIRKNISEEVIVTFVQLEKLIRLQGSRELIKETKQIIDDFLEDRLSRIKEVRIRLNPPCYRYGITMALLKEFGDENLQRLAVEIGSNVQLRLRMPMQQLYFYGIEAEYDKLLEWLRDFSERLPPTDELSDVEPLTCAICTCAPNSESFYCFEACGHYACIECLNNQINSAITNLDFPICCMECGQPYVINDFMQLMMDGRKRNLMSIRGLIDSSLTFYMNRNIDKYRPCITPNCRGIHQVTPEPNLHACTLCRRELCSHCGNESHRKLSCEEYGRIRSNADESIVQWIEKDPDHRRRCPKCGTVIEKEAGCNHMQCEKCKIHFCWLCPFSHEESGAVYAHLQNEHGGLGADLEALLQDIDDPAQARRLMAELRNQGAMAADVWDDELVDDDEWFEDEPWTLEQGDEDLGFDLADNIGDGLDEMDMWSEDYEDIGQDFVDDFDGDDVDLPDEVDHMDMDHLEDDLNSDDNGISIWDDGQTETEYE